MWCMKDSYEFSTIRLQAGTKQVVGDALVDPINALTAEHGSEVVATLLLSVASQLAVVDGAGAVAFGVIALSVFGNVDASARDAAAKPTLLVVPTLAGLPKEPRQ